MRASRFLMPTLREVPADAEIASHRLMLRGGFIRQLAAGIYTWLPLGLRVLHRVAAIVREEMDRAGAQEVLMSGVQPAELWQESGRWEKYGPELLRFTDRHERRFCLGPTHEEVVTDFVRREIRSYRQLPLNVYQIQTKFRDEIRPRFGIMRAREFLMKDAYSFHMDERSLDETFEAMYAAYQRIFERIGLDYRAVRADSGAIGGSASIEFHVLADAGEDVIAISTESEYAANLEMAASAPPTTPRSAPAEDLREVETPGVHTIEALTRCLGVPPERTLKTLVIQGEDGQPVVLALRGDHTLNAVKAQKLEGVAAPLKLATPEQVRACAGCEAGSVGPVGLGVPVIADYAAVVMSDFVCGANSDGRHLTGVNWARDLPEPSAADLRNVVDGDPSPEGPGVLKLRRGIEAGHIFKLGMVYSEPMKAQVLDENGRARTLAMGCYGIGVSRLVAAAIEQHHDERGILWPPGIAPFHVALVPINHHKSERLREAADAMYESLLLAGLDVLYFDVKERPGVVFNDIELIGIPFRVVMSDRGLDQGTVEFQRRTDRDSIELPADQVVAELAARLRGSIGTEHAGAI